MANFNLGEIISILMIFFLSFLFFKYTWKLTTYFDPKKLPLYKFSLKTMIICILCVQNMFWRRGFPAQHRDRLVLFLFLFRQKQITIFKRCCVWKKNKKQNETLNNREIRDINALLTKTAMTITKRNLVVIQSDSNTT